MNLLGHALLSFDDAYILCGNMMGDFVKGKNALANYPEKIQKGLLLHRQIDEFTDRHPAFVKAKNIFRPDYRLYSGAIVDVLFDHFLANDARYFQSEAALLMFTKNIDAKLSKTNDFQTPNFRKLRQHLEADQILFQYRNLKGLRKSLDMLCHRMKYANNSEKAWQNTMRYYYELNQHYLDFIDLVVFFSKKWLNQ